jgi:hypothetical protein
MLACRAAGLDDFPLSDNAASASATCCLARTECSRSLDTVPECSTEYRAIGRPARRVPVRKSAPTARPGPAQQSYDVAATRAACAFILPSCATDAVEGVSAPCPSVG